MHVIATRFRDRRWRAGLPEFSFGVVALAYLSFAIIIVNAPLRDLPDHLTRAHIISDLLFDHGAVYGRSFVLVPSFVPYLAGDLLLASLDRCLGIAWATRLWIGAALLLLPFGAWFVLRTLGTSTVAALAGALLAFYVATDYLFVEGMLNYQLSIACSLFAYGWFTRARERGFGIEYVYFLATVILAYLMHLSGLIFVLAMTGTSLAVAVLSRKLALMRAVLLIAAPCALLALHFILTQHVVSGAAPATWGSWSSKILLLSAASVRFHLMPVELPLLVAFLAIALLANPRRSWPSQSLESLLIACVFLLIYALLPSEKDTVTQLDVRALPYALQWLTFAGVQLADRCHRRVWAQAVIAMIFALVNLGYVAFEMLPQNAALGLYRAIAAAAPAGSAVLPINTRPAIGRYRPFYHAGDYATLDAAAETPYLFAADASGSSIPYFSYVRRRPAPWEGWYHPGHYLLNSVQPPTEMTPSWDSIRRDYQYLLITLPWDATRVPLTYSVVAQNNVAALLRIRK
jgi:hypothetical protein